MITDFVFPFQRLGAAKDSLVKLVEEKQKFDLVFIDADKTGYLDYYKVESPFVINLEWFSEFEKLETFKL